MTTNNRSMLDSVLDYAARGCAVLPCWQLDGSGKCACGKNDCKSPGKHPITSHGVKDSTKDETIIKNWWTRHPNANIGIATGHVSGMWVLDVDGPRGLNDLAELEAKHEVLPKTPVVRTGGCGRHYFFSLSADCKIGNRARIQGLAIDSRGDGGYVVVPPSNHHSGRIYEWEISLNEALPAFPPDWLLKLVLSSDTNPANTSKSSVQHFDLMTEELNLDTASGVEEGQRHDKALRLIGSHLGRGENPFIVLRKALKWSKSCNPALEDKEILKIVEDLFQKDLIKNQAEEGLIEQPEWPTLGSNAFYGLAGDIVRAIEPQTEADSAAILIQFLVYFGNVIGRSAFFTVEATKHYPNLFAILVGDTAKARKGTSEGWIRDLFKNIDEPWVRLRILSGLSSGEGLIWAVRDPIERLATPRDKLKNEEKRVIISDSGVSDKRLLVIESEFGGALRTAKREGNILTVVIRDAWDSGNLNQLVKQNPARATGAHVSIIGHITREELSALLGEVESFNGFANRFLWICVTRSKLLPEGGCALQLLPFWERTIKAMESARTIREMTRSAEAKIIWREFYAKQADKRLPGRLGAVTDRAEAITLRLSLIFALLDCSPEVRPEHLQAAIALWKYAEDSARFIFGTSTGNSWADKILLILRSEGSKTRKEIYDRFSRHCKQKDLDFAFEQLTKLKLVYCEKDKSTGGRPAERWTAI